MLHDPDRAVAEAVNFLAQFHADRDDKLERGEFVKVAALIFAPGKHGDPSKKDGCAMQ